MILHEIPGALERPSNCAVVISQDSGVTTIDIPPAKLSFPIRLTLALFSVSVLMLFLTGAVFYTTGKPVLFLYWSGVSEGYRNIPETTRVMVRWLFPIWVALVWVCCYGILAVVRRGYETEHLTLNADGVTVTKRFMGRDRNTQFPSTAVRGFIVREDNSGLTPARLLLLGRGESLEIGECLRPVEREWLASAGNALLRVEND